MSPSGKYGINVLTPLINIYYAIALGRPTILYGETIGNYNNAIINYIANRVFNRINLITVREELSKHYLDQNNILKPKIHVTADLAFTLNPATKQRALEILSSEGIEHINSPLIGLNASKLIHTYMNKSNSDTEEELSTIIAETIDALITELGVNILLIPHVFEPGLVNDDTVAIDAIYQKVKEKSKINVIRGEYSPQELKAIIGLCDLFIGARMHTTIASTSMLVPTVGIAYSQKMHGIIGEMLGQSDYIVDIKDISSDKLITTVINAWENKDLIKKDLEQKIPQVKEKALLNGRLVKELIDSLNESNR